MADIIDLKLLFPDVEKVKIEDESGKEYIVALKIPSSVGLKYVKIFGDKKRNASNEELAVQLVHDVIMAQHKDIDQDWLDQNISLEHCLYLSDKLTKKLFSSLDVVKSKGEGSGKKK